MSGAEQIRARYAICLFLALSLAGGNLVGADAERPLITHTPSPIALQGQSITIKARVVAGQEIKSVILHYSTSRDVAPFKLEMQSTGRGVYVCAIPANLLSHAQEVTYYIEATDRADVTTESPWHTVSIQTPRADAAKPPVVTDKAAPTEEAEGWWTTPKIVTGGLLVAGGVTALLVSQSSKGGGGDSGSGTEAAGTYVGSVSSTLEIPGQQPVASTHGCTLSVLADGSISSRDLHTGQTLEGRLAGSAFSLAAIISEPDREGRVTYAGALTDGHISGSIGGTVHLTSSATNGTYYGTFYGVKQ
jgi:hypothetical protein